MTLVLRKTAKAKEPIGQISHKIVPEAAPSKRDNAQAKLVPLSSTFVGGEGGFTLSFTVISKLQLLVFWEASCAVQVSVVVPKSNRDPDAGSHVAVAPGQLSFTVGEAKVTETGPDAMVVMSPGQLIVGASVSLTVMTN